MRSDTSERGLETIIITSLVDEAGYIHGDPQDYDRDHAVDLAHLLAFLQATQPQVVQQLGLTFPSSQIEKTFRDDPYRFLIVADKFQTGYDEPLLHTMYVDKQLSSIKAVQTLSRLNRAHPQKHDTFVLDFMNDTDVIAAAFADYYRTTILSEETDPNKLHDLQATIMSYGVYTQTDVDRVVGTDWKDIDKIRQVIAEEIPAKVVADKAYQNAMRNSDKQNARIEHDNALQRVILDLLTDHTELFKKFSDVPSFKRWLGDTIFTATYQERMG